jgi:glycolate oxidase iron-sulfur subunit
MQTNFTAKQLEDPKTAASEKILRSCVHCGFCTATCPTYLLLGDELDSPRGRIYLIKDMLEGDKPASKEVVTHIDRCLSCLSCMTTCPSGVHYMHLVDIARERIEDSGVRPRRERALRAMLSAVLTRPKRFAAAVRLGRLARPLARRLPGVAGRMAAMLPRRFARDAPLAAGLYPAEGARRYRIALLKGCVQEALAPAIEAATVRLLTRHGCEVVVTEGAGCCGALDHHLGRGDRARALARANVAAWLAEADGAEGLDAVIANAAGCGTMIKDYGFLLRGDGGGAAARISALTRDVSEFLAGTSLIAAASGNGMRIAWQAPCSLQHGQKVTRAPIDLLRACGFEVATPTEPHMCCGSAGTYSILQPGISDQLRRRKLAALEATRPQAVASGNIGCMSQLAVDAPWPMVHVVELLDWATGGPRPAALGEHGAKGRREDRHGPA